VVTPWSWHHKVAHTRATEWWLHWRFSVFNSFGLGFVCFMQFIWFDVFKFLYLACFFFFTYLCFIMFYLTHVCMLDMDECFHASLVYLWYTASECTWELQVRWGSNDLPYDFQLGFKFVKPFDTLLSAWTGNDWYEYHPTTY